LRSAISQFIHHDNYRYLSISGLTLIESHASLLQVKFFTERLGHLAKIHLHSVKAFLSFALGKGASTETYSAKDYLSSAECWPLGKEKPP